MSNMTADGAILRESCEGGPLAMFERHTQGTHLRPADDTGCKARRVDDDDRFDSPIEES